MLKKLHGKNWPFSFFLNGTELWGTEKQPALARQPVPAEGLGALLLSIPVFWGFSLIYRQTHHLPCSAQFPLPLSVWRASFILSPSKGSLPSIYWPALHFWVAPSLSNCTIHTEVFSHPYNQPQKPRKEIQHSAAVHRAKPNENVHRDQRIRKITKKTKPHPSTRWNNRNLVLYFYCENILPWEEALSTFTSLLCRPERPTNTRSAVVV